MKRRYVGSLERKAVDGDNNVEHIWEQVKLAMVESARKMMCGSMKGGKSKKSMWWNDEIKAAVWRNEAAWKELLVTSDEKAKERCKGAYREEKG